MKRFFILSCAAIAVCNNASAEVTLSDSLTIHTIDQVSIVTSRATSKSPIPHTELSYEQIEHCNFGEDIPSLLSSMPSVVCSSESGTGIGSTSFRVRGTDPTRINVKAGGGARVTAGPKYLKAMHRNNSPESRPMYNNSRTHLLTSPEA